MPITYGSIKGEESSTVTFKVRSVIVTQNSTAMQQEILSMGDPLSSNAIARVLTAPGASTEAGLAVWTLEPSVWTASTIAAAAAQASVTRSSAANVRPVCRGFTVTMVGTSTTPSVWQGSVSLIDGASGGSTYLWRSAFALPAVAGAMSAIVRSNIWIPGSLAGPLTLEFSSSGGANTIQSITMEGASLNG